MTILEMVEEKTEKNEEEKPAKPAEQQFCWKRFCWRSSLVCLEVSTVIIAAIACIAGILLWRVNASPLEIPFAKAYVERALQNPETGMRASMDKLVLHWPDLTGPLLLGLQNAQVYGSDNHKIISIAEVGLALSKSSLFVGKIVPTSIILRKPTLQVIRTKDNHIDVGFGGSRDSDSARVQEHTQLMARILEFVAKPGDEDEDTPFATLKAFEIQEAQVSVQDEVLAMSWDVPRVNAAFASTENGLKSSLVVDLPLGSGEKQAKLVADINYGWDDKTSRLRARVTDLDLALVGAKFPQAAVLQDQGVVADVGIEASLNGDFVPQNANVTIASKEGFLNVSELSKESLPYNDFNAFLKYDGIENIVSLSKVSITSKGVTFAAEADLAWDAEGVVTGPVTIGIANLEHEQIDPLWPEIFRGDNAEEWIVHNVKEGSFKNVSASTVLHAAQGDDGWRFDASETRASFDFENLTVHYRDPLFPVTQGKGSAYFDVTQDKLMIDVEQGMLGELTVDSAQVEIGEVILEGKDTANVSLKLHGPLSQVFAYTEQEPIELPHGFDLTKVQGDAQLQVNLRFDSLRDISVSDVGVDISGSVDNVNLPDVLQGLALSGGPYSVSIKGNEAVVDGSGKFAGRDVKVRWQEFLDAEGQKYTSKIKASLTADPELRKHFGIDLEDFIEGNIAVSVDYTEYGKVSADAYVSADLTPSRFFVKPFAYEKKAGVKGEAKAKILFKDGELAEIQNLIASAPSFSLENTKLVFDGKGKNTELRRGDISRLTIGETVGKAEFEIMPQGGERPGLRKIGVSGPFFDLRPFLTAEGKASEEEAKEYEDAPLEISISADQMRTSDDGVVQYGKIYADIDGKGRFNQLEFDAIAGTVKTAAVDEKGKKQEVKEEPAEVYLRFKPDDQGVRTFRLEADNAGAALKAFQVYDNIRDGRLVIYAEPIRGVFDRNLIGVAEITDFKVVKAPGLAKLLGALSLSGVVDLLGNEGIGFTKLESKFDWLYRPQGGLLVLKEGRTSGNSLGLTFDGVVDNPAGTINVSGTIVPISGVNNVLGSIPLIGDILTGGSGGVFAATYEIEGALKEPDIDVNPLSVLAPGILRRILFE